MNNGTARRSENSDSMNILLFSISALLCSCNQLMNDKFSSTIDEFSKRTTNKIQRLIDFHHFLSKSHSEPSQIEFYSKRSHFCFLSWGKFLIVRENVLLKWFSLWIFSRILLSKTFVHRWETLTDLVRLTTKCSHQVKKTNRCFVIVNLNKRQEFDAQRENAIVTILLRNNSSTMMIFKWENLSLTKKEQHFFFEPNTCFFFCRIFLSEKKNKSKDLFIPKWMKNCWRKSGQSITEICSINKSTRTKNLSNEHKKNNSQF